MNKYNIPCLSNILLKLYLDYNAHKRFDRDQTINKFTMHFPVNNGNINRNQYEGGGRRGR